MLGEVLIKSADAAQPQGVTPKAKLKPRFGYYMKIFYNLSTSLALKLWTSSGVT